MLPGMAAATRRGGTGGRALRLAAVASVAVAAAAAAAVVTAAAQSPDTAPPSLQGAGQSLNLNTVPPTLTISFNENVLTAPSGAVPGANMSLVEIVGVAGRPSVGLDGAAVGHASGSLSSLVANLTASQHAAASAAYRTVAPLTLAVRYGAVHDASGNPFAGASNVTLYVTPDTTRPSAAGSGSLLNLADGTLRMYFDEPIDAAAVDLGGVTVRVAVSPSETVETSMAGASASQGAPGELVVTMTGEQRLRLVALRQTGAGSADGAVSVAVSTAAIPDFAGNYWIGTLFGGPTTPDIADDTAGPALLRDAPPLLNLRAGTLALYFDEAVNRTSARPGLVNVTYAAGSAPGAATLAVGLDGARIVSHSDSDVLVIALAPRHVETLRAAAGAAAAGNATGMPAPPAAWAVSLADGAVRDMAGNPSNATDSPAAAAHAAPARHACMGAGGDGGGGPCRYGILGSYGEAAAWSGQAIAVSDDGSRSYVAYGPPPGSRAARVDAVAASAAPAAPMAQAPSVQPIRTVAASVEFEPPAPGVSSSVRAMALDGATGAPFMAVREAPVPGAATGTSTASSYLAPLHPATLAEMRRVPLSYASHNGTAAPNDIPTAAGIDALRRLVLAAVSDAPANASSPYRSRGAVLSADADALLAHPMYPAGNPDPSAGYYYHPYHAWQPTAMAVNGTPPGANASAPSIAYVAGAALDAAAAQSGLGYPSSYGIHTILLGNASGFSPNYTSVHSLILAGPHAAARPDAASFSISSLALDAGRGVLYALYANGTLAAHALAPGAGAAAGYAVPGQGIAAASGLAGAGPGLSLDAGRGLLYAAPADLSSVLVYDLRAAGGPALAAEVPVPPPVSALAASASDGTVHVLGGMPGGPGAPLGAAAYVVGPGAAPLALAAPPTIDLRTGTLLLALDRRAVASSIDPSGVELRGSGRGASEPVRLSGAAVLSSGYTAAPEVRLTEAQRRAAAAIHAWDGPLLAGFAEGALQGVVGAPLAAVASAEVRVAAAARNASLVLAAAVSPYEVRVDYDAPVNATASLYGGLSLEPGGRRAVEAVRGAGTAVHILEIDRAGGPLPPDAAGTLEVRRLPDLGSRSTFDGAAAAPVSDAQRPSVASAVVIDNASVAVFFDEPVAGAGAAGFGPLVVGAQDGLPPFAIAGASGSGPYRLLHVADGSPPVPRNAHGSLAVEPASFEDMAGNPGAGAGAGGTVYVTPGRATATTDGRSPVPATPGMYARAIVASTSLGASLDLSPLGGRPLPADGGPVVLDAFDATVVLPPGASVVSGMPADGVIRASGSQAEAGPRASIGGGRILAMADTGGAGGAPVRLDAPAAVVVPGAGGDTIAFLQEPGGAPAAVLGPCGDLASQAVRPADLRAAAEAHLNGSGSCAADLAGDKVVVSFVLATVGVAARSEPGVQRASDAAVCGDSSVGAGSGSGNADDAGPPAGLAGCAPPHVAVLDTGGLAATAVAAAPAEAPDAPVGQLATVFVAASDPGPFGNGNGNGGSGSGGPSILVYSATAGGGVSHVAASSLGAGRSVLALEADAGGGGPNGSAPAAYAVVAGPPPLATAEGGSRAEPPAVLARINAGGEAEQGAADLEYVDALGRAASVGTSDRIPALHVDAAGGRAYVAVLANASARGGLGADGPILAVDTAADPDRLLRQHAGPYDPRNASAGAYYYPAEAWRPTALAVWHGQPPVAYAVGARLSAAAALGGGGGGAGQGAPADPLSGAGSHGIQAVSFAGAGDPPAFTPNYTLRAELEIARYPGGGAVSAAAVPGLPAAGAALDGAGEKLYVLYGNGTLSVYAAGAAGDGPPRPLYILDEIDGPSALASSAEGILYAAGSGGLRAYDMRADMLIGSLGMPGIADIDASSPGTVYAVGRGGAVLAVGGAAAAPPGLRPSALESLVAATPDGGTALVAPGRYDNVSLVLDRPVRLAADPPGSAVLGPSSRIVVLVPPSGTVTVEGLAFSGTRCPSGADPSAPESAAIRISDGAWAAARQQQQAGGSVAILSNSFAGTCGAAVFSNATAAAGLAVRSNAIESAGAGRQGAAIAVSGLAGAASVESNRVFGAAGLAVSVHNVSGAVVSGNHIEDAAGGGVSASSSSAVRVAGNTFAGLAGPAVVARDMRPADAAANATGIFSDGLAATLNAVYGTDVALSVQEPAGPRGEAASGAAAAARPTVRFNFNELHAHEGTAPAISSDAPGARIDARSNYYPGLEPGSYPRLAGSAQGHILAEPAAAPPGGPLRIGVLLDAASHPHIDGPAAEAARAAADEANRRAVGPASAPPVELVEAGGSGAGGAVGGSNESAGAGAASAAAAARAIASGAASDERMKPVLLRRIADAASWHAESPDGALARIAAAPNRGHAVFAADASGTVLAASDSGAASPVQGLLHPAAAADLDAFAAAVGRLSAVGGIPGDATAWLGHALPDGSMVRTLLAYSGGIVLGASYEAGPPPRAYVGTASAAGLAAASAALPAGTPIVSHAVVDGRAVAEAGPLVFSMAPAAADSSAPLAGQVMAEDRAAAVIPVVQADDYSLRFAAAALAEYAERMGDGGTVLHSVSFAPSEESAEFWSSAAAGMEAAAAGLAEHGGLAPHEVAVLYVGGGGPFEALAYQALSSPALAGAQWHVGDAMAQASQPGAAGPPAAPWYAPYFSAAPNSTSTEELSRRAPIVALSFEPARGLGIEPAAAALADSVLAEIRLRQAASAQAVQAAHGPAAARDGTMADAYAYLAYDAVLVLAVALPAAEAADPDAPEYGAAIRQAASQGLQPAGGGARIGIVGGAAFDAGGSLAHPAPYAVWASAPSGPPARAGTFASPPPLCGIALAEDRLDLGGARPGGASAPVSQAISNAGTAPLEEVAVDATDWAAPAGSGGRFGAPSASLPFSLTEVAAGRPPPGAPPPALPPGEFAPIAMGGTVLAGLAPGNAMQLHFVLNLTSVAEAAPSPVEQTVSYTAACR